MVIDNWNFIQGSFLFLYKTVNTINNIKLTKTKQKLIRMTIEAHIISDSISKLFVSSYKSFRS